MRPLRVAITTLGCKVNRADGEALLAGLHGLGVEVAFDEPADLYIVNSCTVTAVADRQSRQLIYRARRQNPAARIILTGCLAAHGGPAPADVDEVFPLARHAELVEYVRALVPSALPRETSRPPADGRARPVLKVQDGCDQRCSYCIVPSVRGGSRSILLPQQVRERLHQLAAQGFAEVVLTGIHLGHYGRDLQPCGSLAELVSTCLACGPRLRLSSIEPLEIEPPLIELLAREQQQTSPRLCAHLHIPIQSADDEVLTAMRRPYRSDEVWQLLQQLHARAPAMALAADLIAGFPGESEAAFLKSLRLVEEAPLTHLHAFPFSPRPGTVAAACSEMLPAHTRRARAARLRQAARGKLLRFAEEQLGTVREVLVEKALPHREGWLGGVTDNYLRVALPGPPSWIRQLVPAELLRVDPETALVEATARG